MGWNDKTWRRPYFAGIRSSGLQQVMLLASIVLTTIMLFVGLLTVAYSSFFFWHM